MQIDKLDCIFLQVEVSAHHLKNCSALSDDANKERLDKILFFHDLNHIFESLYFNTMEQSKNNVFGYM